MLHRLLFTLTLALLLLGTLTSGWVHGRMTNRWGETQAMQVAAERLKPGLPKKIGMWRLTAQPELERATLGILQCASCLQATYTNDQTGDSLAVLLLAGPSGPTAAHTPEICYAGHEYAMAGERQQITVTDREALVHTLWKLRAVSKQAEHPDLDVGYAWSDGQAWRAERGPRFAFAGLPVLYKVQVAGTARDQPFQVERSPLCSPRLTQRRADHAYVDREGDAG